MSYPDHPDRELDRLRAEEEAAANEANRIKGTIEEYSRGVTGVPDAEEEIAASSVELERIRKLDETIERALEFLQQAQDATHRTIAPLLKVALERWLPAITNNRYTEALVDPETLRVRVRGASQPWRDAHLLSHGTAEQIYLLLRVAMSEYLTIAGEVAPLLLDDVTVQADVERQEAILEVLKTISTERQVILFSQERDVYEWAKLNLEEPENRVICLPQGAIPA